MTLRGTLHLPEGKGPHPAIVYAQGSGPATRDIGPFPMFFAQLGFAVLAFDKRGAGESEGNWKTAGFDDLAGDILAGVGHLKARPEVDGQRIGIWGVSQGGWTGSLAASRSQDVRFLVVQVGSGVKVWENVVHEAEGLMRDGGLSEKDIQEGLVFARKVFRMAADGASFEQVAAVVQAEKDKPWVKFVYMARVPKDSPWWAWYKLNGHVDPSEILPKIRCPVLWLLGDRDSQVPTKESEPRIRAAFAKGQNPDVTVKVLSSANHGLIESGTGLRSEIPGLKRLVPGYLDTMAGWLREHNRVISGGRRVP